MLETNTPNTGRAQAPPDHLTCSGQSSLSDDAVIMAGLVAWHDITKTQSFPNWLRIGEAMAACRKIAMHQALTNKPEGSRYNRAFADQLQAKKLNGKSLAQIDGAVRKAALFDCLRRRAEIERWLATLTDHERSRLNSPVVVLRTWKRKTQVPDPDAPTRLSPMAKLKQALIDSEEEKARMRRAFERGGGDLWSRQDRGEDIGRVWFETLSSSQIDEAWKEVRRLRKEKQAHDRGNDQ